MKPQGHIPPSAAPSAHEGEGLHVPSILRVAGIIAVTLGATLLALLLYFRHLERAHSPRTSEAAPRVTDSDLPPAPRLQADPLHDLQMVRALEDSRLKHYGWIDQPHGIARIPIDRAMVLWVKSYAAAPPTALQPQAGASQGPATSGTTELPMRQQKTQESSHAP